MDINEKTFTEVNNAEGSKMKIRMIKDSEKAVQVELQLTVWLPKSVVKKDEITGQYNIPYWIIAKSIK